MVTNTSYAQYGYSSSDGYINDSNGSTSSDYTPEAIEAVEYVYSDEEAYVNLSKIEYLEASEEKDETFDVLDMLAYRGYFKSLKYVINVDTCIDPDRTTIAAAAANFGPTTKKIIQLLIQNGYTPDESFEVPDSFKDRSHLGFTTSCCQSPFHWLVDSSVYVQGFSKPKLKKIRKDIVDCVDMLLNVTYTDVNPNILSEGYEQRTPLTHALINNQIGIAKKLLRHPAINPNVVDEDGCTTAELMDSYDSTIDLTYSQIKELLDEIEWMDNNYYYINDDLGQFRDFLVEKLNEF